MVSIYPFKWNRKTIMMVPAPHLLGSLSIICKSSPFSLYFCFQILPSIISTLLQQWHPLIFQYSYYLQKNLIQLPKTMKSEETLSESLLSSSPETQAEGGDWHNQAVIGGTSWIQTLFVTWVLPLLRYAQHHTVKTTHMPTLPQKHCTQVELHRFLSVWSSLKRSQGEGWTLLRALVRTFKKEWLVLGGMVLLVVCGFLANPILTSWNIDYLNQHRGETGYGVSLFLLTFGVTLVNRTLFSQYFYRFMMLGIKLSSNVTMAVYHKSLKYSPLADKQFSEAEIINYSQVDAERLIDVGDHVAQFIYGPLMIIVGLVMMYFVLGIAFLTTIGVIFIVLLASYFLSKITVRLNEQVLSAKDHRMKATEEMLDIIRFIKISAIEKFFFKKVEQKRGIEVKTFLLRGINFVCVVCLFWLTSPLIVSATFMAYILLGNDISPEAAFTTMTIVNMLQYSIYSVPTAISQIIQIFTSLKRIQKFLFANELSTSHISRLPSDDPTAIQIKGSFYWKAEKQDQKEGEKTQESQKFEKAEMKLKNETERQQVQEDFKGKDENGRDQYVHALKSLDIKVVRGSLTMVLGDIGSGKSSLMQAIVNQMLPNPQTTIKICGDIAYCPQKPWIMSATLQDNITFAAPLDQPRLRQVIHFACLEDDLKLLPGGLVTEIGQKGVNLSGGQKARVSLARALYSDRDILLLDDILSAVDVHVGQFIVRETLGQFCKGKTVLMPTHAIKFAPLADHLIILSKGSVVAAGPYSQVSKSKEFQQVCQHEEKQQKEKEEQMQEAQIEAEMIMMKQVLRHKTSHSDGQENQPLDQMVAQLVLPEEHDEGAVEGKLVREMVKMCGGILKFGLAVILSLFFYMLCKTGASIMVQLWCNDPSEKSNLYLYIGISVMAVVFMFIQSFIMVVGGAKQSGLAHQQITKGLLYASLTEFYNRVPTGRIVNRLTKDLRELDEALMNSLTFVLTNLFELFGILSICIYTTSPLTLIPILAMAWLARRLRKYYLAAQREVARLEKSTNSPVVSGFLSAIQGLPSIRSFGKGESFLSKQMECFDVNKQVRLTRAGLQNWFANLLAYMCFVVSMPCLGFCMFWGEGDPATMGLLMMYLPTLTNTVIWLSIVQTEFQTKLVSLQRIYRFMHIQPEPRYQQYCSNWQPEEEPLRQTVRTGDIEFRGLSVRYRKDLPDVLKHMNCTLKAGEKIGIVGRTGAGKTTIINTLLGVTHISQGQILLDNQSIVDLPLKELRQSVTMIDQEPTLIKSTFRQNLDLTGSYPDSELQKILQECNLMQIIAEKGGLDAPVSNTSLSAGEKQLLCICRAFLKHSRIVLIDEATANIDAKNDTIIQKVIAEKFKESTVLTIAHRLSTLKKSDKIMVMEKGELVEFGDPTELEGRAGGVYARMIRSHEKEMLI